MAARLQQILVGPFGTAVMPLLKREREEIVIPISLLARDSRVPHGGLHGKTILINPVRLPLFRGLDLGMEPVWQAAYHAFQHPTGSDTEADQVGEDTVDAQIDPDLIDELEEMVAPEDEDDMTFDISSSASNQESGLFDQFLTTEEAGFLVGYWLGGGANHGGTIFCAESDMNVLREYIASRSFRNSQRFTRDRALGAYRRDITAR
ncbi:hypothetical protein CF326_g5234 [Tilletia indica]|nr:hypothetical protein CF326_g5234 [Tilletia indica]